MPSITRTYKIFHRSAKLIIFCIYLVVYYQTFAKHKLQTTHGSISMYQYSSVMRGFREGTGGRDLPWKFAMLGFLSNAGLDPL